MNLLLLVDPCSWLLVWVSICCIWISLSWNQKTPARPAGQAQHHDPLSVKTVAMILSAPLISSVVLLLLYLLANQFIVTVAITVFFGALSVASLAWNVHNRISVKLADRQVTQWAIALTVAVILAVVWFFTGHWLALDCLAISNVIAALSLVPRPAMWVCAAVLGLFAIYDVFWVFISPFLFESARRHSSSVMLTVAQSLPDIPLVIKMPRLLDHGVFSFVGLGDIILPGLYLIEFVVEHGNTDAATAVALGSYAAGAAMAWVAIALTGLAQPALLYLAPVTIGTTLIYRYKARREFITAVELRDDLAAQDSSLGVLQEADSLG